VRGKVSHRCGIDVASKERSPAEDPLPASI
jgi:hypothetical protein